MVIHKATKEDASSILRIYSYYVEDTAISFEYTTPSLSEFEERISNNLSTRPIQCNFQSIFKHADRHCIIRI